MNRAWKHPRGSAFIITMWVLIAITGVVLVLSRSMRVEAIASANRLSQAQAEATERGAEQFLCSVVDQEVALPGSTTVISMEGRQIGNGYFWVMKPDPNDEQNRAYGLTDEAGKLDINSSSESELSMLPYMTSDVAASIAGWSRPMATTDGLGATDADYEAMQPEPYEQKHAKYETTEELLLVKGVTTDLLFGLDKNRDGTIESNEMQTGGISPIVSVGTNTSNRGIFPCVTVYGVKATTSATTSATGTRAVSLNAAPMTELVNALQPLGGRASSIAQATMSVRPRNGNGPVGPGSFVNVFDWAVRVGLQSADFSKVISLVTAAGADGVNPASPAAKINVNTASLETLMCIPNLEQSDAQAIVDYRKSNNIINPADISWLINVIPQSKLTGTTTGNYFTGKSCVFSGDIVAVSPDARAFRRYRVVIDGSKTPAYIIYRRDLTGYGWPLPAAIRASMRAGNGPPAPSATVTGSGSLLGKGL